MKKLQSLALGLLGLSTAFPANAGVTIHTIGDSTMADYATDGSTDKRGWSQMFGQFLDDEVSVNNRGKSGASSKSFYQESAYWTTVLKQISEGDYVFIQFSHNDEKNNGMDGDEVIEKTGDSSVDYRGTIPQTTYKKYLRLYVTETRELGATPVLVAPMCRKYFSGSSITRKGKHDLGDSYSVLGDDGTITTASVGTDDHTMDYPYAMKEVAEEMDVPFIDLTTLSAEYFAEVGNTYCTNYLFCDDDSTHPNALGATQIARLVANAMVTQNILAEHVQANADLLVNPTAIDFGNVYVNQSSVQEFSVSGFDLSPSAGTLTITASDGFYVSADKENYASTYDLAYTDGNITYTTLYIKALLTTAGSVTGTLSLSNGTNEKQVTITAKAVELADGTEVTLVWPLTSDDTYTLDGPATAIEESWSEMVVNNYAEPKSGSTTWPDGCEWDGNKTQRNVIDNDTKTWPAGEIDEVSTRYIQFGITANDETRLQIDNISLYVGGAGGSGMRCKIYYCLDENFGDDATLIEEFSSMTSNTMNYVSTTPIVSLSAGESLYLRVYPWYNGTASGKTICLSHVTIHGVASAPVDEDDEPETQAEPTTPSDDTQDEVSDAEAVSDVVAKSEILSTTYYNILGQQQSSPCSGVCIVKQIYTDGKCVVSKTLN